MRVSDLLINMALLQSQLPPKRSEDGALIDVPFDFRSPSSLIRTKEDAYVAGWKDGLEHFARSCMRLADRDVDGDESESDE
jgi:hypothetical protein